MKKTKITDFKFTPAGYGHYSVTYTSTVTGKQWSRVANNMELIDATKNTEEPKTKDLEALKRMCKR